MGPAVIGAKPLQELMLTYCPLNPIDHISIKSYLKFKFVIQQNENENTVCQTIYTSVMWDSKPGDELYDGYKLLNIMTTKYLPCKHISNLNVWLLAKWDVVTMH